MRPTPRAALSIALFVLAGCAGKIDGAPDGGSVDAGGDAAADGDAAPPDAKPDGDPHLAACERSSDCTVVPASCCGSCGQASRGDALAIAKARAAAWRDEACSGGQGCPACYREPDPTLVASCESGTCTLHDWLASAQNTCATNADCRIRTNACCECGGGTGRDSLVAVPVSAGDAAWSAIACDASSACPECAPSYPSDALAVCEAGHCAVSWYVQ